jgi:hypothetical protein
MKPKFRAAALLLAATMALGSTTALAADTTIENDKMTVVYDPATGATASFAESTDEKINVIFESDQLIAENQYLIMMVQGSETAHTPTESSILYIDQQAAVATSDGKAKLEFSVYPSSVQDSVIVIYGANSEIIAAIVDAKYILGDVNGDRTVDVGDATLLLRYVASLEPASSLNLAAADADNSGKVDVGDATKILRVLAHLDSLGS